MAKAIDLTGQRFNRLIVIERDVEKKDKSRQAWWKCKCDCGNELSVRGQSLRSGNTQSCGCYGFEKRVEGIKKSEKVLQHCKKMTENNKVNMLNYKIGKLTVIGSTDITKNGSCVWKCKCDCGNEISVKGSHLKNGSTISCGCYQKELAKTVIPKSNWKTNKIIESDECILIKSSNTEDYFIIDSEDYDKVKNYCWCNSHGYAVSTIRGEKNKFVGMHRIIMNCGENENLLVVDHINHNTLDNRKSNLRIATDMQNNWNSIRNHNSGIQYNSILEKWNVTIKYNLQDINLGLFDSYNEALDIRDKAEKVFFEEFQYNDKKEGDEYKYKNFNKS